jgi:hypothetical protein
VAERLAVVQRGGAKPPSADRIACFAESSNLQVTVVPGETAMFIGETSKFLTTTVAPSVDAEDVTLGRPSHPRAYAA